MKKKAASKLVFGAALACQVGHLASVNAPIAHASIFSIFSPLFSLGKTLYSNTLKPLVDPTLPYINGWLSSSPQSAMALVGMGFSLWPYVKDYSKKAISAASNFVASEGEYTSRENASDALYSSVDGFEELSESAEKIERIANKIIADKESNEFSGNDKKQVHVMVVSGVKTPARKSLVDSICDALYTGEPLKLDLTEFDDCEDDEELLSEFVEKSKDSVLSFSEFDGRESNKNSSLKQKIQDYVKKNSHGVVKIKVTPKILLWLDDLLALLMKPKANGTVNLGRFFRFNAENATFIFELEENAEYVKSIVREEIAREVMARKARGEKGVKARNENIIINSSENSVDLPEEIGKHEAYDMLKTLFDDSVIGYASEKKGIDFSDVRLYESIHKALLNNKENISEEFLLQLKQKLLGYIEDNEEKLTNGNFDIIYDGTKDDFSLVGAVDYQ